MANKLRKVRLRFDAHVIPRVLDVSVSYGTLRALDEKAKAQGKGLAGYVREVLSEAAHGCAAKNVLIKNVITVSGEAGHGCV